MYDCSTISVASELEGMIVEESKTIMLFVCFYS